MRISHFLFLLFASAPLFAQAEEPICVAEVRFAGNKVTREEIMLQEMSFRRGDCVDAEAIERSRQSIMDLGLFQSVEAQVDPDAQAVTFKVKEKIYILPIPLLNGDVQTQDVSYGLELRLDNLWGLNQRAHLLYEREQSNSIAVPQKTRYRASYNSPRLLGTPYDLGVALTLDQEELNVTKEDAISRHVDLNLDQQTLDNLDDDDILGEYRRDGLTIGTGVSRWLVADGPSSGWRGGFGLLYRGRSHEYVSGQPGLVSDGQAISMTASLGLDGVHDHGYYLSGSTYGWSGEMGLPLLGSNYSFTRNLFYYRIYHHFADKDANLNWQLRVGFADGHVFGGYAYSIGGFTTLRGYEDSLDGNALALSNLEYHFPLDGYKSLRGIVFLDVGNAYPEIMDMDPGKFETGLGLGFRWKVQFLVDVTVSADVGYGVGPGEKVFYLGTSGTF